MKGTSHRLIFMLCMLYCFICVPRDSEATVFRSQPLSCVLSTGQILSLWQVNDSSGNMYIESNVFNGSSWGTASLVSIEGQKALAPAFCADNFGNAVVVYVGIDPVNFNKYGYVTIYTSGYGWSAPAKIAASDTVMYQSSQPVNQISVINYETGSIFVGVWCGFDSSTNSVNIYSTTAAFSTTTGWNPMTTVVQISP